MSSGSFNPNGFGWIALAGLFIGLGLAEIGGAISDIAAALK